MFQHTIAAAVHYEGIGLHSGKPVHLSLFPAPPGTGIVFIRTDLPGRPEVQALASKVTSTLRATMIEAEGVKFFTIEHLMSAFHAAGIDNCRVELDAEEPPVGDGSALVFLDLIGKVGVKKQEETRREVVIDRVFRVDDNDRFIMAVPSDGDGLRITFTSLNPHPLVGIQYCDIVLTEEVYRKEIGPARTIAYEAEVEALRKAGLGLGGNLDNTIVYNDDHWLNDLRYPDELVRHKVLDVIGDLRLAGFIRGHIIAVKSAHVLNTALARAVYEAYAM